VFVITGKVEINGEILHERDGGGWIDTDLFSIITQTDAKILMLEVPV
jgi:redox-sensitive bicupin YhaK (pirin superfamily)